MKYMIQGVLLTLTAILVFHFISFISSIQFVKPESSNVVDYDIRQSDQNLSNSAIKGQEMFYTNCAACHAVNKRLTGPALAGFEDRGPWKDRKQVYAWIKNPAEYMKRNSYTKKLYKEYQVMMSPFPDLTNQEIDAVIDCVNHRAVQYDLPVAINIEEKIVIEETKSPH